MTRKTSTPLLWAEHASVAAHFQRSVHLERDASDARWLDDYLFTPLAQSLVRRIGRGLAPEATSRAWSITGPYGSGKSAFALFLSHVFSAPELPVAGRARARLRSQAKPVAKEIFGGRATLAQRGLLPVRATGERRSLEHVLLCGLREAVEQFWKGASRSKSGLLADVREAAALSEQGARLGARRVVSLFEEVSQRLARSGGPHAGLLVILDEAGRALEHAAQQPRDGDVHLLQELAEAANRSGDAPFVFIVLLHQAFEHYASRLSVVQRNEWAKIQGRFEDIPFQEANEQILRLIAAAIDCDLLRTGCGEKLRAVVEHASSALETRPADAFEPLLLRALPLHPITALALGPLFRSRLAQNERSLFAFLASTEPSGFRAFLNEERAAGLPMLFNVDALYDYLISSYGSRLQGREWGQIETALARLPEHATALDARLVKAIGVLGALRDVEELRPSANLLELALAEPGVAEAEEISDALARLKSASIVVYRKYRDAYQLWEGSDLDLDELVQRAMRDGANVGGSLATKLAKVAPPRPLVARKHAFEKGTLRYFELRYADETLLDSALEPPPGDADGFIWLLVPTTDDGETTSEARLRLPMTWLGHDRTEAKPVIVAMPEDPAHLRAAATELTALEWVLTNTPELRDDPVARTELETRLGHAQATVREELAALAGGRRSCRWYRGGRSIRVGSARQLARVLSNICDEVYCQAPVVHNELLNRAHLSSAGAAARRELMTRMVERPGDARLAIEGHPPELSMYRSLLEAHALHRRSGGGWHFMQPRGSLEPAWAHIQSTLRTSEQHRVNLAELYGRLSAPPFGIKAGVLPVLVLAAVLEAHDEVAIYESGVFVPHLDGPVIERLLRSPERFEMQRFRIKGARRDVFLELAALFEKPSGSDTVLEVVRALVKFASKLSEYARNTRELSKEAAAVREALLRAREPGPLLFRDLPAACGCPALEPTKRSPEQAEPFVTTLRAALTELQRAYPRLLDQLEGAFATTFGLPREPAALRSELALRGARVIGSAFEPKLKSFLVRATDDALEREVWLVSLGTVLAGKPPYNWRDDDLEHARLNLSLLSRRFQALEGLLMDEEAESPESGPTLMRISVAERGVAELERVVAVREADSPTIQFLRKRLEEALEAGRADCSAEDRLAALALAARDVLRGLNRDDTPQPEVQA